MRRTHMHVTPRSDIVTAEVDIMFWGSAMRTFRTLACAANASAETLCSCGVKKLQAQRVSPKGPFNWPDLARLQFAHSRWSVSTIEKELPLLVDTSTHNRTSRNHIWMLHRRRLACWHGSDNPQWRVNWPKLPHRNACACHRRDGNSGQLAGNRVPRTCGMRAERCAN